MNLFSSLMERFPRVRGKLGEGDNSLTARGVDLGVYSSSIGEGVGLFRWERFITVLCGVLLYLGRDRAA